MTNEDLKFRVRKSVKKAVDICGSQRALAEKSKLSQGAISKYVRGDALPTGVSAKNLSAATNYEMSKNDFAPHIFDE